MPFNRTSGKAVNCYECPYLEYAGMGHGRCKLNHCRHRSSKKSCSTSKSTTCKIREKIEENSITLIRVRTHPSYSGIFTEYRLEGKFPNGEWHLLNYYFDEEKARKGFSYALEIIEGRKKAQEFVSEIILTNEEPL